MTHDDLTSAPNPEQDDAALSHDAIGAYILGALPDDERIAFEQHLQQCPSCQEELRELGPIAALLPRLYDEIDLPEVEAVPADLEPSPELKEHILAGAAIAGVTSAAIEQPAAEQAAGEAEAGAAEPLAAETGSSSDAAATEADATTVPPPAVDASRKPRGRIAPGEAPPDANIISIPRERKSILPWAIAAAAAILATGAILWALAMMGQIDDLKGERDLQDQQIAEMNAERQEYLTDTKALVYPMVSTTSNQGDEDATGMVYMDPDPEGWGGIIAFRGMSQPPSGQVYQLWLISDGQVTPGPTFVPDADGKAMVQVGGGASEAGQMAITMEPDGGSQTPTTSPVMQGDLTA